MVNAGWPPNVEAVDAARSGDQASLEAIYRAMKPRLRAFLVYQGLTSSAVDEITSDVSSALVANIGDLRKAKAFEAWFWAIARNQLNTWLRQQRKIRATTERMSPHPTPPDEIAVARHEHGLIRGALARLSPTDRTLLWLREVEGLGYSAIAEHLGISASTARVRCFRARRRLEAAYDAVESPARTKSVHTAEPANTWRPASVEG